MDIPLIIPGNQVALPRNLYYLHEGPRGGPCLKCTPAVPSPWLDLSSTHPQPVRAGFIQAGILYVLIGSGFYKTTNKVTYSLIGSVSTLSGRAKMICNGTQIMVAIYGVNAYVYDISAETLTIISDTDLPAIQSITAQDTYALVVSEDTADFYVCTAGDYTAWDPLDYEEANRQPDNLVGSESLDGELWEFGTDSIELYIHDGTAAFPFKKVQAVDHSIGLGAADSLAVGDTSIFFLDNMDRIRRSIGYATKQISTEKIEQEIADMSTVSDAKGFTINWYGSWWYVITFPTGNKTFIYDISASAKLESSVWYRWTSYPDQAAHRINQYLGYFNREHLIGDRDNGIIWKLDGSLYHDNGHEIISEWTSPHIPDKGQRQPWSFFELDMQPGVGLTNDLVSPAAGSTPSARLEYSDDNGKTWTVKGYREIGEKGEYEKRMVWRRLGMTRRKGRIFRAVISSPVERTIYEARGG